MGKIIGVLNQKGGVGKSTVVSHLAISLYGRFNFEKDNKFVAVYDSDIPQYSISGLRAEEQRMLKDKMSENNTYYEMKLKSIYHSDFQPYKIFKGNILEITENFNKLRDNFQYTFIDVVGTLNTQGFDQKFIKNFDFIIVPMSNEFEVVRSTISFVSNIIHPLAKNKIIGGYGILFNNVDSREKTSYENLKEELKDKGYNIFDTVINDKKKYVRLYMHFKKDGHMSTLFPFYDQDIDKLTEELIEKLK